MSIYTKFLIPSHHKLLKLFRLLKDLNNNLIPSHSICISFKSLNWDFFVPVLLVFIDYILLNRLEEKFKAESCRIVINSPTKVRGYQLMTGSTILTWAKLDW